MHSLAAQQAVQDEADNAHGQTVGTAYELQLAQLHQHRLRLKDLHSVERKIEAKRVMLPEYDA
ncbi:MAG: terminase, partial [Acidovorax temperans]